MSHGKSHQGQLCQDPAGWVILVILLNRPTVIFSVVTWFTDPLRISTHTWYLVQYPGIRYPYPVPFGISFCTYRYPGTWYL